jgi:hypothetical protein
MVATINPRITARDITDEINHAPYIAFGENPPSHIFVSGSTGPTLRG